MEVYHVLPLFPTVIVPAGVDLSSRMVEKAAEREIYDALHCSDLVAFLRRQETASCDLLVATDVVMYLPLGSSGMKPFGVSCDVKWGAKYQPFLWYNCALLDALYFMGYFGNQRQLLKFSRFEIPSSIHKNGLQYYNIVW